MPGSQHGPSIKNPRVYDALRRRGYSKERSARISNAQARRKRKTLKDAVCLDCVLASIKAQAEGPSAPAPRASASGGKPAAAGGRGQKIAPGITRIRGNLCNVHGRYGPCDGVKAGGKKPKGGKGRAARKPKAAPKGAAGATPKPPTPEQARREQERQEDRQARLARQQQRDEERASDRAKRAARQAEADKKRAEAADKKPQASGGRGKKPKKRKPIAARGGGGVRPEHVGGSAGAGGGASGGGGAGSGSEAKPEKKPEAKPEKKPASKPSEFPQQWRDAVRAVSAGRTIEPDVQDALIRNGLARIVKGVLVLTATGRRAVRAEKSFAVFKDSAGNWRWLARTTTAYEDRDEEVISTKALDQSAASLAARGPLRWWHMGRPDPTATDAPWGAGVDLGWTDFAAMSGKTLIESGTFKSEAIARAVAAKAEQLEISPGFFHAAGEPDASGVFHHIRIFERSLVPKWAGRASNPYTGLIVEKTMDQKKIQALKELGASDEVITALLADVQQTEKSAEADGVRYKDARPVVDFFARLLRGETVTTKEAEPAAEPEEPPPVEDTAPPPDPIAILTAELKALREEVATLKAGPPMEEEEKQDEPMMEEAMVEEAPVEEEPAGEGGLTLSSDDLQAIGQVIGQVLSTTLEPLIGALGITQKLEGHMGELKTLMGGYAKTKDDAHAALLARLDQAEATVADLAGDSPRQPGYRASQAADNTIDALNAAVAMKDGNTPTADAPFADLVQQLFGQQQR